MAGPSDDPPSDDRPSATSAAAPPAHIRAAWRTWLSALGTDAEAAMAAALAYESLPADARDAWLDALGADGGEVDVPAIALYAPLLAVEADADRRARIEAAIAADRRRPSVAVDEARALRGVGKDGTHACVLVAPVYLDFVQVISCRYTPAGGFVGVQHEPLRHVTEVGDIREVGGVAVEPTPLRVVVEELAHAILADRRGHRQTPAALASVAHLFGPDWDDTP